MFLGPFVESFYELVGHVVLIVPDLKRKEHRRLSLGRLGCTPAENWHLPVLSWWSEGRSSWGSPDPFFGRWWVPGSPRGCAACCWRTSGPPVCASVPRSASCSWTLRLCGWLRLDPGQAERFELSGFAWLPGNAYLFHFLVLQEENVRLVSSPPEPEDVAPDGSDRGSSLKEKLAEVLERALHVVHEEAVVVVGHAHVFRVPGDVHYLEAEKAEMKTRQSEEGPSPTQVPSVGPPRSASGGAPTGDGSWRTSGRAAFRRGRPSCRAPLSSRRDRGPWWRRVRWAASAAAAAAWLSRSPCRYRCTRSFPGSTSNLADRTG